jgi:hypothetical protein
VWLTDCGQSIGALGWTNGNAALYSYVYSAALGYWVQSGTAVAPPASPVAEIGFRSVTSRTIGVTFTLYLVSEPAPAGPVSSNRLWTYTPSQPASTAWALVATSPPNTLFKSSSPVMLDVFDVGGNPSPPPTPGGTPSNLPTPTPTISPSLSTGATPYPTSTPRYVALSSSLLAVRLVSKQWARPPSTELL